MRVVQRLSANPRRSRKRPEAVSSLRGSHGIQWWIVAASAPAYFGAHLVRTDACWFPLYIWSVCLVHVFLILILGRVLEHYERTGRRDPSNHSWLRASFIASMVMLPWGMHAIYRMLQERLGWNYPGEPNELLAIASLQNAVLSGAMVARTSRGARLVVSISFFLMLFSVIIASDGRSGVWVNVLAVLYGLIAIWWMMGDYWERLQHRFVGQTSSTRISMRSSHLVGVAILLLGMAMMGYRNAPETRSLDGFLPTSGGERTGDSKARSGIGDGDMLVGAQENAFSFGPVESNLFIEDKQPSLYDMMSELNGEVVKKKRVDAAVGIEGAVAKQNHQKLADSEGSSREFSIIRQAPKKKDRKLPDSHSEALLYYIGPSPQRLALETYESFDGSTWRHQEADSSLLVEPFPMVHDRAGKPWIMVGRRSPQSISTTTWTAAVKWIRLKSPRIPTPDQLNALHIDRVDRPEFFAWTPDEILEMTDREQVPALTTARLTSLQRNLHHLRNPNTFRREAIAVMAGDRPRHVSNQNSLNRETLEIPSDAMRVRGIAVEWTRGIAVGWAQIDAIEQRLQSDFQVDNQAVVPEGTQDAVIHFLESKRGPAYLFATSAAMLTRSLGYPSRIATGLYIDPQSYDSQSRQHHVYKEHLHWWPQVSIDGKEWISFEPTPTFFAPAETLSWSQWVEASVFGGWRWFRRNVWSLCLIGCLLGAVYRFRVWMLDHLMTLFFIALATLSSEWSARWSLHFLDLRSWFAGHARPRYRTHRQWYPRLVPANAAELEAINLLLCIEEYRLFSPARRIRSMPDRRCLVQTYRTVFKRWTIDNIREQLRDRGPATPFAGNASAGGAADLRLTSAGGAADPRGAPVPV